jgi:hypothetical protein
MRAVWAICAAVACVVALAATQTTDFPLLVVLIAILTMVVSWL